MSNHEFFFFNMDLNTSVLKEFSQAWNDRDNKIVGNVLFRSNAHEIFKRRECEKRHQNVSFKEHSVPSVKPVTDQKSSGRCWIFAGLNAMRTAFVPQNKNFLSSSEFEFSQSYISFHDHLEKALYFLNKMVVYRNEDLDSRTVHWFLESENLSADGGQYDMFANLVRKYGLVPKSIFGESVASSSTLELKGLLRRFLRASAVLIRSFVFLLSSFAFFFLFANE